MTKIGRLLIPVLALTALLLGCPHPGQGGVSGEAVPNGQVTYVRGDPEALIAGTSRNTESPITEDNLEQWNQFTLMNVAEFTEVAPLITTNNLLLENATKSVLSAKTVSASMRLKSVGDGAWQMTLYGGGLKIKFERSGSGRQLQPVRAVFRMESFTVTPVHWSVSADGNYLSLLLSLTRAGTGRELMAIYLQKSAPQSALPMTDTKYVYFLGEGVKVGWKRNLNLRVCGADTYRADIESAVALWAPVLAGRLKFGLSDAKSYPPFSDLNSNCIYVVNSYLYDGREQISGFGLTTMQFSQPRTELVDSDIFLFQAELEKIFEREGRRQVSREQVERRLARSTRLAVLHEIGHLLGLGHKFNSVPSVMSYEKDIVAPTAYDVEALQELYPLR